MAGRLAPDNSNPPTYAHILTRKCDCGLSHVIPPTEPSRASWAAPQRSWEVCDLNGNVLAIHERRDYVDRPKKFTWKMPNGHMGLDGISPNDLLYGMETLGEVYWPVVITEGENAADCLRRLEIPFLSVLGTVCGAPQAPSNAALMCLVGRRVFLWPDNDEVGRKQMTTVAERLKGVAAEVHIISWGEREKDDAADFVARGGTKESFTALAKSSPLFTIVADAGIVNWSNVKVEDVSFLWNPYIPRGKVTIMEGAPGVGKSFICLSIAAAVTVGYGLPGMTVRPPEAVLFMSAEDGIADTLKPRIQAMKPPPNLTNMFSLDNAFTFDANGLLRFDEALAKYRPGLVVFDPVFAYFGSKVDINRANETREIMTSLYERAMKFSCSILVVRHQSKGGSGDALTRGLGSIDITAAARSVLLVGKDPNDESSRAIVHIKSNLSPKGMSLSYGLDPRSGFQWKGRSDLTSEDVMGRGGGAPDSSDMQQAVKYVKAQLLERGSLMPEELVRCAKNAAIPTAILWSATSAAGLIFNRGKWHLPAALEVVRDG